MCGHRSLIEAKARKPSGAFPAGLRLPIRARTRARSRHSHIPRLSKPSGAFPAGSRFTLARPSTLFRVRCAVESLLPTARAFHTHAARVTSAPTLWSGAPPASQLRLCVLSHCASRIAFGPPRSCDAPSCCAAVPPTSGPPMDRGAPFCQMLKSEFYQDWYFPAKVVLLLRIEVWKNPHVPKKHRRSDVSLINGKEKH